MNSCGWPLTNNEKQQQTSLFAVAKEDQPRLSIRPAPFASLSFRGCSFHRVWPRKVEPVDYKIVGFSRALNGIETAIELSAKCGRQGIGQSDYQVFDPVKAATVIATTIRWPGLTPGWPLAIEL